jgi:hypothetical protein
MTAFVARLISLGMVSSQHQRAQTSGHGTELPIRDVRCHGESWGQSGLPADIVKMARLTPSGPSGFGQVN